MPQPRWKRVANDLRHKINAGAYQPGQQIPTVTALMEEYDIGSPNTITRAFAQLLTEGLVTTVKGHGTYVRRRDVVRRDLADGLRMEYQRAVAGDTSEGLFEATTGTDDVSVSVDYQIIHAPERISEELGVSEDAEVLRREFRYAINGLPHQVACSYLPVEVAQQARLTGPQCEHKGTGTIAQLHTAGVIVDQVEITIETRMPTERERRDLAITPGTPVYEHWRVMFTGERAVEVSTATVPGDRVAYVMHVDLTRKDGV